MATHTGGTVGSGLGCLREGGKTAGNDLIESEGMTTYRCIGMLAGVNLNATDRITILYNFILVLFIFISG